MVNLKGTLSVRTKSVLIYFFRQRNGRPRSKNNTIIHNNPSNSIYSYELKFGGPNSSSNGYSAGGWIGMGGTLQRRWFWRGFIALCVIGEPVQIKCFQNKIISAVINIHYEIIQRYPHLICKKLAGFYRKRDSADLSLISGAKYLLQ